MGDFDKQRSGTNAAAEKKKLVVVCGLGAILLGIGAVHFLKPSPTAATASIPISGDPSPLVAQVTDETPAQAQAALQDDPTAKLLRGSQGADPLLDGVPRNPFRISQTWETLLVRRVDETPTPDAPHVQAYAPVTSAPKVVDVSTMKLTGIFRQDQHLYAIINGDIYTVGMAVDNARILDITNTKVTFRRVESINGPKATLTIEPKLK